jgi:hypothetical protein
VSLFHIHMHEHRGAPGFSRVDLTEAVKFVPDLFNSVPAMLHGAIVLSHDRAAGHCWPKHGASPEPIGRFASVGAPLRVW